MKGQYIELTMGAILFWYIKVKGSKLFQEAPHLPEEIYSVAKAQDNIWWGKLFTVG